MSLLALILAGATGESDPRPAVEDATLLSMRPDGRRIGLITVGPSGDYTTLAAAASAASAIQSAKLSEEGRATLTPNDRVDILVAPGTYTGTFTAPKFTAWYATDTTPGSTTATYTVPAGVDDGSKLGTLASNGALYWEGIDVRLIKQDGEETYWPKYPIHHVGFRTSVFARCTLHTDNVSGTGSITPIGMDGLGGGTTVLYGCTLSTGPTNMHGEIAGTTVPETVVYVDCSSESTLQYSSLSDNATANELWVVGCTAPAVTLTGAASTLHLSGSTITTVTAPNQDTDASWPVPYGGFSAADRAAYGLPPAA